MVSILAAVPFELFCVKLKTALVKGGLRRAEDDRKSAAGLKHWDEVLIFKVLVLQALYNLSDDAMEYQLRDRLSFMRFAGLGLEDAVPDANTAVALPRGAGKGGGGDVIGIGCRRRNARTGNALVLGRLQIDEEPLRVLRRRSLPTFHAFSSYSTADVR